jgi:hypothetical protein
MAKNVDTSSVLGDVAKRSENKVPENEVPGTAVPENKVPGTSVPENDVNSEPDWYCDGDAWVKLFLEPVAPGKFKQFDVIYNVPGENEFPKERWSSDEGMDGFHITRRRDVWFHLSIHEYKSAYIAEVVSMGEEFYDQPERYKRKVRVVAFGQAVPLVDVLSKHPDDFKDEQILAWSARNNHIGLAQLVNSKEPKSHSYSWAFNLALENGNDQIVDFLIEKCGNDEERQRMLNYAIDYGRVDFVKRLIENTPVAVSFFKAACLHGHFEIFQLLCDKYGEPKYGDIIVSALRGGDVDILARIKSRGVDMSDFEMFVYACTDCASSIETLKYLVSAGARVKHPLIAYIAKIYAYEEEREFLLAEIDDKAEVSWCDFLETKIGVLCNTFKKRIKSGAFDGAKTKI